MNRRHVFLGLGAIGGTIVGSAAHQWLLSSRAAALPRPEPPAEIPLFDAREVGVVGHVKARLTRMLALRDACIGPLTPLAGLALGGADAMARRWVHRSGSPYAHELDDIARVAGVSGVYLLNTSYEWGCTTLSAPSVTGDSARLLRTLDWPYAGMGQLVEVVRQNGPAGEFWNITWPGAVGALTAIAPRRFAAAINQAPFRRRASAVDSIAIDAALNGWDIYNASGRTPALHLLRTVFETARDYSSARAMLETTPIANATIYSLVGVTPQESCVIERTPTDHVTREGVASAANDWRYGQFAGRWQALGEDGVDKRGDSRARSDLIEKYAGKETGDFAWVRAPILNGYTRLAVEADPGRGTLSVRGYEQSPDDPDAALPATKTLTLDLTKV